MCLGWPAAARMYHYLQCAALKPPVAPATQLHAAAQVAEYVEQRPELAAGLSKKGATLRSASVQFQVQPCQPVTLR